MLVSAAWIGPAILGAVNEVVQRRLTGRPDPGPAALLFAGFAWLLYAFLTPLIFAVSRRWPIVRPDFVRNISLHIGVAALCFVAWAVVGALVSVALIPGAVRSEFGTYFMRWFFGGLPYGLAVYVGVVGIEHAIRYFVATRERETQLARVSEQLSAARLSALQARVNPHFLFNTLNTIAVFVRDGDRVAAGRMIEQLSDVLRRTLDRTTNEVTLQKELELVAQYLRIEQQRYSDRLTADVDVPESLLSAAVPVFAIQHLVENAVRHGIARSPHAGRIRITAKREYETLAVSVIDDGEGFEESVISRGHGIDNTRQRLHALHGEKASLVVTRAAPGGTIATLSVPYRELRSSNDA